MDWASIPAAEPAPAILGEARLAHVGIVVRDLDAAMAAITSAHGVRWRYTGPRTHDLVIAGQAVRQTLRIAHSIGLATPVELIEAAPASLWATASAPHAHHHCYSSADAPAVCARLMQAGATRLLGRDGDDGGYFRLGGRLIELLSEARHATLAQWINAESA